MMLRANLATRPFYNERLVHVVLAAVAALVVLLAVVNVARLVTLSKAYTEFSSKAARDEVTARELSQKAAAIQRQIRTEELKTLTAAAREANALIDQRTFSWTEFFNRIETTMPPDVMLAAVRPHVDRGLLFVQMVVIGRRVDDIDRFMESLEATGAFQELLARQEEKTEDGFYRATLRGRYVAHGSPADRAGQGVAKVSSLK